MATFLAMGTNGLWGNTACDGGTGSALLSPVLSPLAQSFVNAGVGADADGCGESKERPDEALARLLTLPPEGGAASAVASGLVLLITPKTLGKDATAPLLLSALTLRILMFSPVNDKTSLRRKPRTIWIFIQCRLIGDCQTNITLGVK